MSPRDSTRGERLSQGPERSPPGARRPDPRGSGGAGWDSPALSPPRGPRELSTAMSIGHSRAVPVCSDQLCHRVHKGLWCRRHREPSPGGGDRRVPWSLATRPCIPHRVTGPRREGMSTQKPTCRAVTEGWARAPQSGCPRFVQVCLTALRAHGTPAFLSLHTRRFPLWGTKGESEDSVQWRVCSACGPLLPGEPLRHHSPRSPGLSCVAEHLGLISTLVCPLAKHVLGSESWRAGIQGLEFPMKTNSTCFFAVGRLGSRRLSQEHGAFGWQREPECPHNAASQSHTGNETLSCARDTGEPWKHAA